MVIKNVSIGLIYIFISFLFSTCRKDECISNTYQFKETWSISPQRDSIAIGDTLFFNSSFSRNPFDYNSNKVVNFSGKAIVGTPFSVRAIKGYNDLRPAIDSFAFFVTQGSIEENDRDPEQIKDIRWSEINNSYIIKFGIIARKKGDYSITIPDAVGKLNLKKECENSAGITLSNTNIANNAYLSHPYYGLSYVPGTDSAHIFCIRVK